MARVASWMIDKDNISKLIESTVGFEKNLETWIEQDPSLVQSGLVIVSRQMIVEGGKLDLLAIDPQGRWVVIEIKAGNLEAAVITQALYYVAQISEMQFGELESKVDGYLKKRGVDLKTLFAERGIDKSQNGQREVYALVVGTGRTSGLNKLINMLSEKFKVPISAVVFDVFEMSGDKKILTRDLTESDFTHGPKLTSRNLQSLMEQAKNYGVEKDVARILDVAKQNNLYFRSYANSIMITPPQNKTRMLFTFWVKPNKDKTLKFYIGSDVFPDFYPISEKESLDLLGTPGWRSMTKADLGIFIQGLDLLFQKTNGQIQDIK
jgi:Holliday junction resolvase-like predicted endonuclease